MEMDINAWIFKNGNCADGGNCLKLAFDSPFEDRVPVKVCEGSGESTEAQHHLLVVADPHGRPEVGVLRHLLFALLEELLYHAPCCRI
jgi:hypothetical protein